MSQLPPLPRVIWQIVDGLPYWLVQRLARKPELSRLGAWLASGRVLQMEPVTPNCQTPPSMASLLSGRAPGEHGVFGYDVPTWQPDNPLAFTSAFSLPAPRVPFLWEAYVARRQHTRLAHVPFYDQDRSDPEFVHASYGFRERLEAPLARPLERGSAEIRFEKLPASITVRAAEGRYQVRVEAGGRVAERILALGSWHTAIFDRRARTRISIQDVDGVPTLLTLGVWHDDSPYVCPFFGAGLSKSFRAGQLGCRIMDGGSGAAERLLWTCLRELSYRYSEELVAAARAGTSDLVIAYQPLLDLLLHELAGLLHPDCVHFRSDAEAVVESILTEALQFVQDTIALVAKAAPGYAVMVASDHGMAPASHNLYPNQLLKERGWLVCNDAGQIDSEQSRAFLHPAETGLVCFNRNHMQRELESTRAEFVDVLNAGFGRSGGPVSLIEGSAGPLASSLLAAGYLAPGWGRVAKAALNSTFVERSTKTGDHAVNDGDARLHGVVIDVSGHFLDRGGASTHAVHVRRLIEERVQSPRHATRASTS